MSYRYYLINRPPFIGTHPTGSNAREVWAPVRRIPEQPADCERTAHGWVEYDYQLFETDIYRYELYPASQEERSNSSTWRHR